MSSTPAPIEIASNSTTARTGSAVGSVRDRMGSDGAGGIDDDEVGLAPTDPPNREEGNDEEAAPSASPTPRGSPSGSPLPGVSMRSVVVTEDQQQECPPSTPTPSGRLVTDEFEYSRCEQSPTPSRRCADLTITDVVQNFRQLPKSERRRALLELKKELDNQSLLSGVGIEEDVNFDGAPATSSDDRSIYSNDGSTAFYTEASTAFYSEASTAFYTEDSTAFYNEGVQSNDTVDTSDYLSGGGCGRNATQYYRNTGQGRSGRGRSSSKGVRSNKSVIYEYEEDKDKQTCSLTDVCVSLFMDNYKVEVSDLSTNQRARGDKTRHRMRKGSGGSKVSRRSKSKEVFEDDRSNVSLILGPYDKKDNDGNERSDQCAQTTVVSRHTKEEQIGEEVLVDDICGGSEVSRKSTRVSTVEERSKSQRGGKKSDEKDLSYGAEVNQAAAQAIRSSDGSDDVSLISSGCKVEDDVKKKQSIQLSRSNDMIWHELEEEMREEVSVNDISRVGSEGSRKSMTREIHGDEFSSDKSLTVGDYNAEADEENKQSNHLDQSNETSWQIEMHEMGEDIILDDIIASDSKSCQEGKNEGTIGGDNSDFSLFVDDYVEIDEGCEQSIQRARSNKMNWHTDEEEMGEEILVDDVICGGSKVTPKSKSGLTIKERILSKRSLKKSDERTSVTPSPTQAHSELMLKEGLLLQQVGKKFDEGDPTNVTDAPAHEDKLCAIKKAQKEEEDSAAVYNFVRECDGAFSADHENIETQCENETAIICGGSKGTPKSKPKSKSGLAFKKTLMCTRSCKNVDNFQVEADEGYEQSIQCAPSNELSWHTDEEEMGEEILADDIIGGGSKVISKSKGGLTFKGRILSKRSFKKSDGRASVTPSPTQALESGLNGSVESNSELTLKEGLLLQRVGRKFDVGDPTNVAAPAHEDKLCAIKKAQKEEEDSAAIYLFVQECDGVLSVDHENIEIQVEDEMDCIGLEAKYSEQMTAQIVKGMNTKAMDGIPQNDPVMGNSKAKKSRLEILERSKGKSDYPDPLSFAAADPAFSASNEVKVGNGVDIISLIMPTIDQIAALIWNSPGKDPVMDEAKLDEIAHGDPGESDVHASRPSINQNARSGITVKERMTLSGKNGEKSDDTHQTFDADHSPIFVSTNAAPALEDTSDVVIKAKQDKEYSAESDLCSLCDGVWDLEDEIDEIIELNSFGVVQDNNVTKSKSNVAMQDGADQVDNEIERETGSLYSEITTFEHLATLFWKSPPKLAHVDEAKLDGIDQGDLVVSDEASRPDVDSISRNSIGGITAKKGDNVGTREANDARQEWSSTKQNNSSFFVSAWKSPKTPKVSNKSQVTTSNSFIGTNTQKVEVVASSKKARSSRQIKSTKPPKSASKGDVSGITPKKKKWREYIDPSSGKPYYSNGITTTWDKPVNVEKFHPTTPIVSNRRKSSSPESAPTVRSNRRDFTITASTPPSMEEQQPQLQPKTQGQNPESQKNEQNQQPRQRNKFKLFLTKKKTPSTGDPSLKKKTNAPCSPDRTVSSTDEDSNDNLAANAATADANVDTMTTTVAATKMRGWREYTDKVSGRKYYSDGVTSMWEKPVTFVPEKPSPSIHV